LEVAIFRKECGDVIALVENALNAASDVKSLCFCRGVYRGALGRKGGGWRRSLDFRMGQLRKEEVLCWLRLRQLWDHGVDLEICCGWQSSEPLELVQHDGCKGSQERQVAVIQGRA
jgi:hypothetical protein